MRAGADDLPARTTPSGTPYRVAVVCLGNICRSPMADVVLNDRISSAGLADRIEVVSAGTGGWHVGGPMDRRAAALLTTHGYDASRHAAQQFAPDWFDEVDLVLAMDVANHADLVAQGPADRVRMFRDFDPRATDGDRDVPDPYYGGDDGFEDVLAMVERTSDVLVAALAQVPAGAGD
ncbi:MAG: low molecular weight protein-tyrosine-phosphatase [Nocardioidaceae bacterium]